MRMLFTYLIFPGFLFALCVGLLACWFERKLSARLQWRVGPPWHQCVTDIIKLSGKETIIPANAGTTFLIAPFIGLLALVFICGMLGSNLILRSQGFTADLIVVLYLFSVPAIGLIIGASASRNPLASVGASREMKLLLAYELPFLLSVIAIIIKTGGSLEVSRIIDYQARFGSNIASLSGLVGFLAIVFCMLAKLGITPFDIAESDQELMSGALIEYSGLPLAVFKLIRCVMLFVLPLLVIALFMGKDLSPVFLGLKYLGLLVLIILIKNTNPRLRIDQAMRFFWRLPTWLGVIAVALAIFGL
jgi:NADH-quinone oxidoreductase subunit H